VGDVLDVRTAGEALREAIGGDPVAPSTPLRPPGSEEGKGAVVPERGVASAHNLRLLIPSPQAAQFVHDRLLTLPYSLDDMFADHGPPGVEAWLSGPNNLFMWVLDDAGDPVGLIGATGILPERSCDVCMFFWSREHARRSFTIPIACIGLGFILDRFHVERVAAIAARFNKPGRRLLVALGFTQEGIAYQACRFGGAFTDGIVYSILKPELLDVIRHCGA
jgi:RimJ/RimL family protein N-acetyltransferase